MLHFVKLTMVAAPTKYPVYLRILRIGNVSTSFASQISVCVQKLSAYQSKYYISCPKKVETD